MVIKKSIPKWYVYFIMLLFIPSILEAQIDSINIKQKILESEESDELLIQRTRNFILNKLEDGNLAEAMEAYNYIDRQYESERIKPFWTVEKLMLCYWFGNYEILYDADSIENSLNNEWMNNWQSSYEYIYPQRDKLVLELQGLTYKHKSELIHLVDSLVVDREKHDFVILFFDWLTFNATEPEMEPKNEEDYLENDLTPRAEKFLSTYNTSRFAPFVKKHFRYVYVINDWGFGYCLGFGGLFPQGKTSQYLKTEFILGMDFQLSWKSILIDAGYDIGIPASIKKPFTFEGKNWNTDIQHNYYTYYISAGWIVSETNSLKITPHLGIGGINMSVCEADKDKAGGEFSMTQTALQYGLTCDFKLSSRDWSYEENTFSYMGVSIGLDYFQFLGNNPIMSDGMLRLRISWIGFGRSILRDL